MTNSITLEERDAAFIEGQVAIGRYGNASEVVRDALRLLEAREQRRSALHAAIAEGVADIEAGRVFDADEVFDELEAELAAFSDTRNA